MANQEHLNIIKQGVDEWNKWREQHPEIKRPDLSGADLSGADLSGANLSEVNLRGANLRSTDLNGANVSGAVIIEADLTYADVRGADLSGTSLNRATLRCANLAEANLSKANLYEADLRRADLRSAECPLADFYYADLREANFSGGDFRVASFHHADLGNVILGDTAKRTDLRGADLYLSEGLSQAQLIHLEKNGSHNDYNYHYRTYEGKKDSLEKYPKRTLEGLVGKNNPHAPERNMGETRQALAMKGFRQIFDKIIR